MTKDDQGEGGDDEKDQEVNQKLKSLKDEGEERRYTIVKGRIEF